MIKRPDELKKTFANGATPSGGDFADLIDSFVPRNELTSDEVRTLREIIAWWRSQNPAPSPDSGSQAGGQTSGGQPDAGGDAPPPTPDPGPGPAPDPAPSGDTRRFTVPANGNWFTLPVTSDQPGHWRCLANTLDPRPSFRVSNTATARVDQQGERHLRQDLDRDSFLPWHTIQFEWLPSSGGLYQLALRTRCDFGVNTQGQPTQIDCQLTPLKG